MPAGSTTSKSSPNAPFSIFVASSSAAMHSSVVTAAYPYPYPHPPQSTSSPPSASASPSHSPIASPKRSPYTSPRTQLASRTNDAYHTVTIPISSTPSPPSNKSPVAQHGLSFSIPSNSGISPPQYSPSTNGMHSASISRPPPPNRPAPRIDRNTINMGTPPSIAQNTATHTVTATAAITALPIVSPPSRTTSPSPTPPPPPPPPPQDDATNPVSPLQRPITLFEQYLATQASPSPRPDFPTSTSMSPISMLPPQHRRDVSNCDLGSTGSSSPRPSSPMSTPSSSVGDDEIRKLMKKRSPDDGSTTSSSNSSMGTKVAHVWQNIKNAIDDRLNGTRSVSPPHSQFRSALSSESDSEEGSYPTHASPSLQNQSSPSSSSFSPSSPNTSPPGSGHYQPLPKRSVWEVLSDEHDYDADQQPYDYSTGTGATSSITPSMMQNSVTPSMIQQTYGNAVHVQKHPSHEQVHRLTWEEVVLGGTPTPSVDPINRPYNYSIQRETDLAWVKKSAPFFDYIRKSFRTQGVILTSSVTRLNDYLQDSGNIKELKLRGRGTKAIDTALDEYCRCTEFVTHLIKHSRLVIQEIDKNGIIDFSMPGFDSFHFDIGKHAIVEVRRFFKSTGVHAYTDEIYNGALGSKCIAKELMQAAPDLQAMYDAGLENEAKSIMYESTKSVLHNLALTAYFRSHQEEFTDEHYVPWTRVRTYFPGCNEQVMSEWDDVTYLFNPSRQHIAAMLQAWEHSPRASLDKFHTRLLTDPLGFLLFFRCVLTYRQARLQYLSFAIRFWLSEDRKKSTKQAHRLQAVLNLKSVVEKEESMLSEVLQAAPKHQQLEQLMSLTRRRTASYVLNRFLGQRPSRDQLEKKGLFRAPVDNGPASPRLGAASPKSSKSPRLFAALLGRDKAVSPPPMPLL